MQSAKELKTSVKEEPISDSSFVARQTTFVNRTTDDALNNVLFCLSVGSTHEHGETSTFNVHSNRRQVLHMRSGEADITIEPKLAAPVNDASNRNYDDAMLKRSDVWHQVMIHHGGTCTKQKIMEMLFGMFPLLDFFPVAYRRHVNVDYFMIRMCSQAVGKLLDDGLKLKSGKLQLEVSVRLGAARYHVGQMFPREAIAEAVKERCVNASKYGMSNVLNLENFAFHPRLDELCINLGNRSQLEAVCMAIAECMASTACINTLRLSNNNIFHATPMAALRNTQLVSLDLSENRIKHPSAFRTLKEIPLVELQVKGNNLTDVPDYAEILRGFFPTLLKLDDAITVDTTAPAEVASDCEDEVEISSSGVLLQDNELNVASFKKYQITPHWHLVTVHHNGICGKQDILNALFQQLGKLSFFPCYYKTFSKQDEFLVRNCFEALLYLVQQKLKLPVPSANAVLKLSVAMNVADAMPNHAAPLKKLERFVKKRYENNCLDLCSIQEGLMEYKFVDFSPKSPYIMNYILEYASRKYANSLFILRLRNNELQNCDGLRNLSKLHRLVSLDLRYNALSTFDDLDGILGYSIEDVFLDHNPLCSTIPSGVEYIRKVKRYFPNIRRLDGRPLVGEKCVTYSQNFICIPEAYMFAEAFVKHYFTLFDSFQRAGLQELYHPQAQFSMTTSFDIDQAVPLNLHQQHQLAYQGNSRNLLEFGRSRGQAMAGLIVGNERIAYIMNTFPKTEFDFLSFCIDVPIFTPERVLITVHGRLKEETDALFSSHLGFTRTFYIQPCGKGKGLFCDAIQYKIYNDMLHLYDLTFEGQEFLSNRSIEAQGQENAMELTPTAEDGNERENLLIVFKELTHLNRKWCVRCLEDSSWNLKVALNVFLKLYERGLIPKIAFEKTV